MNKEKVYSIAEAIETLRPYCSKKFDETFEIAVRLGIDVKHADQQIRSTTVLPAGLGKEVRFVSSRFSYDIIDI